MAKKNKPDICGCGCCKVESMVSVDERGQLVLPKEIRDKSGIRAGDKLAVVSLGGNNGKIRCIALVKAEDFADLIKEFLGPMAKEIQKK
ncbi:MAG: HgcAB-associated protein [Candidatus Aenigmatarchaeota archaeon]